MDQIFINRGLKASLRGKYGCFSVLQVQKTIFNDAFWHENKNINRFFTNSR